MSLRQFVTSIEVAKTSSTFTRRVVYFPHFSSVINVPIDLSAHARYMLDHQCAAKGQSIYGINATGCSLGCIYAKLFVAN